MGYYQEAYDVECAAIARALAVAAGRSKRHKLGRVRIFTDAQAHDEPGPGQTYAARQAIAILRKKEPAVEIEINWCPAHKGIPGNEVAGARTAQSGGKEVAGSTVMVRAEKPQQRLRAPEERQA